MKKLLGALVAAGVFSFALSSPVAAQGDAAVVKIPFKFIVGDQLLPAGSYRIAPQTAGWTVVSIANVDGKSKAVTAFISAQGLPPVSAGNDTHVQFAAYHGQYFLQEIVVAGGEGRRLMVTQSRAERTLARLNLSGAEPATVVK
jgi:hypothetical protein